MPNTTSNTTPAQVDKKAMKSVKKAVKKGQKAVKKGAEVISRPLKKHRASSETVGEARDSCKFFFFFNRYKFYLRLYYS